MRNVCLGRGVLLVITQSAVWRRLAACTEGVSLLQEDGQKFLQNMGCVSATTNGDRCSHHPLHCSLSADHQSHNNELSWTLCSSKRRQVSMVSARGQTVRVHAVTSGNFERGSSETLDGDVPRPGCNETNRPRSYHVCGDYAAQV